MEKIPLQTLKELEKTSLEEQIKNLSLQVSAVLKSNERSRLRRKYEYDPKFENELINLESDIQNIHLRETFSKIEENLAALELKMLHEDKTENQVHIFILVFEKKLS